MAFINRILVNEDDGRAVVVEGSPSVDDPFLAGIRFVDAEPTALYVQNVAVAVGATYENGIARDAEGVMYVRIDDPPTGAEAVYLAGILADTTGRVSMTTTNPVVGWVAGWPVDEDGSVCITGGTPPPVEHATFTSIILYVPTIVDVLAGGAMAQFYFGAATADDTQYTDEATFLAENPGLTLINFDGIAPPGGTAPVPASFPGVTFTSAETNFLIADSSALGAPYDSIIGYRNAGGTLRPWLVATFDTPQSAVGFFVGALGATAYNMPIEVKDGATVVVSTTRPVVNTSPFVSFFGYASALVTPPTDDIMVTEGGDTMVTEGGDVMILE